MSPPVYGERSKLPGKSNKDTEQCNGDARKEPLLDEMKGVNVINFFPQISLFQFATCIFVLNNSVLYIIFHVQILYYYLFFTYDRRIISETARSDNVTCHMWGWIFLHDVGETGGMQLRQIYRIVIKTNLPSVRCYYIRAG